MLKRPAQLRRTRMARLTLITGTLLTPLAQADKPWPVKPIQLVIPYPPGGRADLLGRPLAVQLQQQLGQPVVLEYKAGAGGTLASQYVARAQPDGYTVLMVLAGSRKLSAKNMNELVQAAKAAPGQLTFGSAGNGNTGHLAAEYFSSIAGIKMTHVPYKGSAGVVNAMLAGDIDLTFDSISTSMPQIRSGNFSALAVTSAQRSALAPEVSTVQEQGIAGFDVTVY